MRQAYYALKSMSSQPQVTNYDPNYLTEGYRCINETQGSKIRRIRAHDITKSGKIGLPPPLSWNIGARVR